MDEQRNNKNLWKLLGVLDHGTAKEDAHQNIVTLCPYHEDEKASFRLDHTNEEVKNSNDIYPTARCWTCQGTVGNVTPQRLWMKTFAKIDTEDNALWYSATQMFNKIQEFESPMVETEYMRQKSTDYESIKAVVLSIFNEDILNEQNPNWEEVLQSLVNSGDLYITRLNEYVKTWSLTFAVGFGKDFKVGEVAYHPGAANKVTTSTGTKNGIFMPFSMGQYEVEFKENTNKTFMPNLLANYDQIILIVEGQKDVLACRLLGIPAITITGGCKSKAMFPEMFANKKVYIVYDNDQAGNEGAEALGIQLMEFAKEVYVSTGMYFDLEEKEDAFDFLFVHKKSINEFMTRLMNPSNFKALDAAELAKLEEEKKQKEYLEMLKRKAVKIDSFYDTFTLDMHSLVELNAKIDSTAPSASHNIYSKVAWVLKNVAPTSNKQVWDKWDELLKIAETIEEDPRWKKLFKIEKSLRTIKIHTELSIDTMHILEVILLETTGTTEKHYRELFKDFSYPFKSIIKTLGENKSFIIDELEYDQKSAVDYTEVWISQDVDFEEMKETGSGQQTYMVFVPSYMIKPGTKIGDKITLIAGKVKKHKTNLPFLVGFTMEYRDPIATFEVTEEVKASLDKFRFVPTEETTLEEMYEVFYKMYDGMRLVASEGEVYSKLLWGSNELTWSSIRRFRQQQGRSKDDWSSEKGTVDAFIVGDSGTGKSRVVDRMVDLYGTGFKQELSAVTVKALIGGSDVGNKNKIVPGILPLNDKGLVIFEELSGIDSAAKRTEIFKELLDIREKGVTTVSRVSEKVAIYADVRMVTNSNPVDSTNTIVGLNKYKGPSVWRAVEVLQPDIPVLNRYTFFHFPFVLEMEDENLTPKRATIEEKYPDSIPFEREDWKAKIKWIWSRREEDVTVTAELAKYAKMKTETTLASLLEIKGSEIGLFSTGRTNQHLMRIALAFAAATISTNDYKTLIVTEKHIDWAVDWLKQMYNDLTGIPKMVEKKNSEISATEREINIMLGKEILDEYNQIFNQILTFTPTNTPQGKAILFDMYKEIHDLITEAQGDANMIAWTHLTAYFMSLEKQGLAVGLSFDSYTGREAQAAWKMAMKKMGVINEHPTRDRLFIVQPKFLDMFAKIEEAINKKGE